MKTREAFVRGGWERSVVRRVLCTALTAVLLLPGAVHADVIRVPAQFANIQVAVNNASDGDVILIAPGNYLGPVDIDDKALTLVVDGGQAKVPRIAVHDLSAGKTVTLRGLGGDGTAFTQFGPNQGGLVLSDNAGHVRVEDAEFKGGHGNNSWSLPNPLPPGHHPDGYHAAVVSNCTSVAFSRCTLTGGTGASVDEETTDSWAGHGGSGLSAFNADVSLTDCWLWGSNGGYVGDTIISSGGDGGNGVVMREGRLYVADSFLHGGDGGSGDCTFLACGFGGSGGDGIRVGGLGQFVELFHHGGSFDPGIGALSGDGLVLSPDGIDVRVFTGSVETVFASAPRDFEVSTPLREGEVGSMSWDGEPGDAALLWVSIAPRWTPLPAHDGVFLVDHGQVFNVFVPITSVGPAGSLTVPFVVPSLDPLDSLVLHVQGIMRDAGGQYLLGPVSALVLLEGP